MKSLVLGFSLLALTGVGTLSAHAASAPQRQNSAEQASGTPIIIGEMVRIKSKRLARDKKQ